jgi:penicillin-insensitive murein endopeptidase
VAGSAQSIGAFSNGCIVGAQALPLQSDTYQVMRTDQRRYFGHPDLVLFIQRLGNQVHNLGLGTMLIGDMGMPAGGRFNGGHASHQTGLDVDIFLQLPKARWSSAQLLKPQALDLVASDGKRVVPSLWTPEISQLIKLAAKITTSRGFSSTRPSSSSSAWMPERSRLAAQSAPVVPASCAYARSSALPGEQPGV